jgi:hypothetical protein
MEESSHEDRLEQKAEETAADMMLLFQPETVMLQFNDVQNDNAEVGRLDVNDEGKLYFEGNAEHSAQIFFDCVCEMFNDYWERRNMVRNRDGDIVPQCEATYNADINLVHCRLEKGHDGGHEDARGNWNKATERTTTDEVPTATEGG